MSDEELMIAEEDEREYLEESASKAARGIIQKYPEETSLAAFVSLTVFFAIASVFSGISVRNKYKKCA